MKKISLILVAVLCFGIITNANDIIPKNEDSEINSKVSESNCVNKIALGLDIGLGGSLVSISGFRSATCFAPALGIRVMSHFNPYFGIDFMKINWITDVVTSIVYRNSNSYTPWQMRLQFMPGVRANSPVFFKCMSAYTAFRLGYGMELGIDNGGYHYIGNFQGLCLETELGLNFTPTVFAGFGYNYHKYFGYHYSKYNVALHTLSFLIGINIGK